MNPLTARWIVPLAVLAVAMALAGCGGQDEGSGETTVATAPAPSVPVPDANPEEPMAPPGGAPMRAPGGGPGGSGGPGSGPGGPGGPGPGFEPRDISDDEKAIFGPAGLPPLPGLGRPDEMAFEGDEESGTVTTEMGGTDVVIDYTASDATPADFGFTLPKSAEEYSAYDFAAVVPESVIQDFLKSQAEMAGEEAPEPKPVPEDERQAAIRTMTFTMKGTFEEVSSAFQEAGGEKHMPMGPGIMFMSTEKEGAMAVLSPVEDEGIVQISLVNVTKTPKAIAEAMGPRMGRPGGMLRGGGPGGGSGMGRGMMGKAPGGGSGPGGPGPRGGGRGAAAGGRSG
ncbi:MAG: hypothetical protein ACOX6M_16155 [Armatimonadota bacterium]|jgi:hypothetical protein|nr:hypothetical protein [candidate division WS1 bacterium]